MTASPAQRKDPYLAFCFRVTIDVPGIGPSTGFFKSVGGLESETEVVPYREGGVNDTTHQLVGAVKWKNIVLKRGFCGPELAKWRQTWMQPGAQRTGGWVNGQWSTASARGPEKNLRTWDQLGLTGDYAGKPIHLYGSDVTLSNWADLIEREAFHGGTKWNPALIEAPRADIGTKAKGKNRDQQVLEAVEADPYAIGFIFQRVVNAHHGNVRVLPLARNAGEPFVAPSAQSFFAGTYPLHNAAYIYLNRVPGQPLGTREKEFVRFILSREGQQILAQNRMFIPLNADEVKAELAKLE